jgi:hypothetical protein
VTPCAVCTVHKEMRSACFLVDPQNQGRRVSRFGPQNRQLWFGDLGLKITVAVSCFGPQNQAADDLSVAPKTDGRRMAWDTCRDLAACFAMKQVSQGFPSLPQNWRRNDDR